MVAFEFFLKDIDHLLACECKRSEQEIRRPQSRKLLMSKKKENEKIVKPWVMGESKRWRLSASGLPKLLNRCGGVMHGGSSHGRSVELIKK